MKRGRFGIVSLGGLVLVIALDLGSSLSVSASEDGPTVSEENNIKVLQFYCLTTQLY